MGGSGQVEEQQLGLPAPSAQNEQLFSADRRAVALGGEEPYLEQAQRLRGRGVELAVLDAPAGAPALHLSGMEFGACAGTVLVRQGAADGLCDDLHVVVRVPSEALARVDAVVV